MINPQDIFRQMQGGGSVLKRPPTIEELDEFIDRVMEKHDMNPHILFQDIQCKINPPNGGASMMSFEEGEIYPLVLQRMAQRFGGR